MIVHPETLELAVTLLRERDEELAALRAERAEMDQYLEGGREFFLDGTEHPTTLLDRVKLLTLVVAAESQGGDEARKALGEARAHIKEYRRCIRLALDEQRGAKEQDVGVLMTDLEDLLDQMADEYPFSKDDEEEAGDPEA